MREWLGKLYDYLTVWLSPGLVFVWPLIGETDEVARPLSTGTTLRLMTGKRATPSDLAKAGFIRRSYQA